ncbi:MAG: acetyltransferase [Bacteroidetes bacterium]|nr:MAG: acetyltransferase [Bacteroidota bacterium]
MSKVILFGCGRGADVAYRYLKRDSEHEIYGFAVDEAFRKSDTFHGLPLVPFENVENYFPPSEYKMFILIGYQDMNRLRATKYLQAKNKGYQFISYINSKAYSIEDLEVGENCFIMENQSINLDVKIGNNVVMWSCNHIGDCSVIEDHVWISSHVSVAGNVTIKEYSFIGVNVSISNNIIISPKTFIGAGAVIAQNTIEGGVYVQPDAKCIFQDSAMFMKVLEASGKL